MAIRNFAVADISVTFGFYNILIGREKPLNIRRGFLSMSPEIQARDKEEHLSMKVLQTRPEARNKLLQAAEIARMAIESEVTDYDMAF